MTKTEIITKTETTAKNINDYKNRDNSKDRGNIIVNDSETQKNRYWPLRSRSVYTKKFNRKKIKTGCCLATALRVMIE